jgi:IS30 family transposase
MGHKQLTNGQRHQIYTLLRRGCLQAEIAAEIKVHASTISRELKRNQGQRGYRPKQAHEKALQRRHESLKYSKMSPYIKEQIERYLQQEWSPEQISGYLRRTGKEWVSHETIYQYVLRDKQLGGSLYKHLRLSRKKRRKRYGSADRRGQIKDRISITERPAIVEKRQRIGDWEIDLVIGKNHKGAVVTIVERLSLMTLVGKVEKKESHEVREMIIRLLKPYKNKAVKTITADNGKEFSEHRKVSKSLATCVYFAHPYSSWERGTNENTNGLIRQYLPKGSSFKHIGDGNCQFIMDRLNNRPRKCLGYRTPKEVFKEYLNTS